MNSESIVKEVAKHGDKKVKLGIVDIDGVLRGKVIHLDKFKSVLDSSFGFCNVVYGWDVTDKLYDNIEFTGWHTGYPDARAKIDLSTFRRVPWDGDIPFFIADFVDEAGQLLEISPRSFLKKQRDKARAMGFKAISSQEFEWFNFREDSSGLHEKEFRSLDPITKGMFGYSLHRASQNREFFNDLFDGLRGFGVPLEGLHTETGPGVYEAAIIYDDILEAADRAVLFKAAVKEIGHGRGIIPTFMAKWSDDYPGCSGHVHQSLWDMDLKVNKFSGPEESHGTCLLMQQYIAGILSVLPEIVPMFAPTVNSYKRLVEGAWAPTTLTWGVDNRTVAVRAIPGGEKSSRVEFRVSGADVNPYLAMGACLAAGLYGIEHEMKLQAGPVTGDAYKARHAGTLPRTLHEATEKMRGSELANELLGERFVQHFTDTRVWEWQEFCSSITDWELKRYFEIV